MDQKSRMHVSFGERSIYQPFLALCQAVASSCKSMARAAEFEPRHGFFLGASKADLDVDGVMKLGILQPVGLRSTSSFRQKLLRF